MRKPDLKTSGTRDQIISRVRGRYEHGNYQAGYVPGRAEKLDFLCALPALPDVVAGGQIPMAPSARIATPGWPR